MESVPGLAHAVPKAAVNLMVKILHFEHEGIDFGSDSSWVSKYFLVVEGGNGEVEC